MFESKFKKKYVSIQKDWDIIKKYINISFKSSYNISDILTLLENACHFAYSYNFLNDFKDNEIDKCLNSIARNPQLRERIVESELREEKKIVFYDYFTLENRGFTQQYLQVFFDLDIEILYICHLKKEFVKKNKIIQDLKNYKKARIFYVKPEKYFEQIISICNEVFSYNPNYILFQNAPWDVKSVVIANIIKSKGIKTFLINITDHAYWPGIDSFDKLIEFRQYGAYISNKYRIKSLNDIVVIPTPPYISDEPFNGFNIKLDNKIIGYSGGSVYKILDSDFTFLNLMKEVINENDDFILLLSLIGDTTKIKKYISANNLENRIFFIGDRGDIAQVFKNIDIYFATYPYGGGLMIQYAAYYKKPVLSLNDRDLVFTRIDCALDLNNIDDLVITNRDEFLKQASRLITDGEYRKYYGTRLNNDNLSITFSQRLGSLLQGKDFEGAVSQDLEYSVNHLEIFRFHFESNRLIGILPIFPIYQILKDRKGIDVLKIKLRYFITKAKLKLSFSFN